MPKKKRTAPPAETVDAVPETDPTVDVLWTEHYRPTTLEEVALDEDNRTILQSYLEAGQIPHLLLAGPPGTGKTTVARIIYNTLDCRHLVLNASSERGIDTVREKVGSFVRAMFGARYNIVFLDEGDAMTADAQTALRNMIESYADLSRFIITANKLHKIIGAIQSRCQVLTFAPPPVKERYRILASVLERESIPAEPKVIIGYANRYTDLRKMLWAAQRVFLAKKELLPATAAATVDGATMLDLLLNKNWLGLRHLVADENFDCQEALRELFWAVPVEHPKAGLLHHVLGRGVHESGFTPDERVLFLGVCAEAIEGL